MPRARPDDDKNLPLVTDIRLLGRILGDVIREQEGHEAFELIERVRQLSVAYRLKLMEGKHPRHQAALQLAVAATGRHKFIALEGAYHGNSFGARSLGGEAMPAG